MHNLRDFGGEGLADGATVRTGLVFRGDAPLGEPALERLRDLRLQTVIDLRTSTEFQQWPNRATEVGAVGEQVPLLEETWPPNLGLRDGFAEFNRWVIEARGPRIASVIRRLSMPGALPALVHCTAGKDRTGIVFAVLGAWLEIPDARIAADYSLSAEMLRADTEEAIEQQRIALGVDVRKRPELLEARPEWILDALHWLRDRYGSPYTYLRVHGVTDAELGRLRGQLVDEA